MCSGCQGRLRACPAHSCAATYRVLHTRSQCYLSDWTDGLRAHVHILAPSTYIFFASVIPALTFGEQLADETEGRINGVHVLISTAMCGVLQAIFGGQPLLIVGVAEPIVLVYAYMFLVSKTYEIPFVPWASVTLFWVALFCALLAIFNTCTYIHHFTRFSGELFGLLIGILFLQQAIKGCASEFSPPHHMVGHTETMDEKISKEPSWLLFNGAFSLFLASGLLFTSLVSITARGWNLYNSIVRRIIADYGTALCVLLWTLVSLIPRNTPDGIPRRLVIPNTFDYSSNYTVLSRLDELEGWMIGAAVIPAIIIAVLFFFDHNVSSQLAQEGLNLKKPTAYHWDFMLLAIMTALCGLLGLPPVNGVIPQAPMHSRSNTVHARLSQTCVCEGVGGWRWFVRVCWSVRICVRVQMCVCGWWACVCVHIHAHMWTCMQVWRTNKDGAKSQETPEEAEKFGNADFYIRENRVSNLLQALLCGVCLLITPVLQQIPRSVLWGFFAFMALEGVGGNQFFCRLKLFVTDSARFEALVKSPGGHGEYLETVPMREILKFTGCQLAGLLICYGITWAGIAGISFPLFIMILVPVREYVLPRFFANEHLQQLDPLDLSGAADDAAANSTTQPGTGMLHIPQQQQVLMAPGAMPPNMLANGHAGKQFWPGISGHAGMHWPGPLPGPIPGPMRGSA